MNPRRNANWCVPLLALALGCLGSQGMVQAGMITYDVTAQTASLTGSSGYIDFQFNPQGSTSLLATASVTSFVTDGTLGAPLAPLGDVSGTLPGTVTLDNGTPTNEYTQGFTYERTISFDVTLSGSAVGGSAPTGSSFLFTLYDSTGTPFSTGPGGAIVTIDINPDGTTTSTAYPPVSPGGPTATVVTPSVVPEPATLVPMILGIGAGLGWAWLHRLRAA